MVVEPDVLVRLTIAEYLRTCGYRVYEALNGEEALDVLHGGIQADLVLSAVKLPGDLDGFALAQRIRAEFPSVQIALSNGTVMAAKKAEELCKQGPGQDSHRPGALVKRLNLLFERRRKAKPA